jgi:hypothetical protein
MVLSINKNEFVSNNELKYTFVNSPDSNPQYSSKDSQIHSKNYLKCKR